MSPRPSSSFNHAALLKHLGPLPAAFKGPDLPRSHAEPLKDAFRKEAEAIRDRFLTSGNGGANVHATARLVDRLLLTLHALYLAHHPKASAVAVVAVGGYGRAELSPHSDIDLLFLYPAGEEKLAEALATPLLHLLWDLRLQVNQSVRTLEDSLTFAREDLTFHTSLMESRFIAGNAPLFDKLQKRFVSQLQRGNEASFIQRKLKERDDRHQSMGDFRYVLEPHLKEGKGGLRDLHILWWIARHTYGLTEVGEMKSRGLLTPEEYRTFLLARAFYWKVRAYMHYATGRAEERLTFDLQREISVRMGYADASDSDRVALSGVERFMKRYYATAKRIGALTRVLCATLEEEKVARAAFPVPDVLKSRRSIDGFPLEGQRLTLSEKALKQKPVLMLKIFQAAQAHEVDIHPRALQLITRNLALIDGKLRRNPEANRLFLEMLTSRKAPAAALRRLNEAGVLGRFIPDFGRIVGQMQFDMYHALTVDEHTIHAINILHDIELGKHRDIHPLASELIHQIALRRALYLALFLHDIAKGRGGSHSEIGARIALRLGPRLGMSAQEAETAAWLIEHHLLLSHTAFKRDLSDPDTITHLAEEVQSLERLKLLLVLTVADIRAVSPKVWNQWKAALLRDLYNRTAEALGGGGARGDRILRADTMKQALAPSLSDWPEHARQSYLGMHVPAFWDGLSLEQHRYIAEEIRRTSQAPYPFTHSFRRNTRLATTVLTLCTASQHTLFAQVAGACAAANVSIISAKIFTLPIGLTVLRLDLQTPEGENVLRADKKKRLIDTIQASIAVSMERTHIPLPKDAASARARAFVFPYVLVDNHASRAHTLIEVQARDRLGLLYLITRTLAETGLIIATAHIYTYGAKAVDVFYVRDIFSQKLTDETKIEALKSRLVTALEAEGA